MKTIERIAPWVTVFSLVFQLHLNRDHFQNPLAAPVGVHWEKEQIIGGKNGIPVQYADTLTLTSKYDLENVEIILSNWPEETERKIPIGKLSAAKPYRIEFISKPGGMPLYPYEINPQDVLIVRCSLYPFDKRAPVKELGKTVLLRDIEKEENRKIDEMPRVQPGNVQVLPSGKRVL